MLEPETSVPRNVRFARSCIASLLLVLLTLIIAAPKPFKGAVVARGYWESSGGGANSIECVNLGTTPVRALVRVRSSVGTPLKEKQISIPGQGSTQLSFKKSNKGKSEPYGSYEVLAAKDKGKPAPAVACTTSVTATGTILPPLQTSAATKSGFFDTAPIDGATLNVENVLFLANTSSRRMSASIELFDTDGVAITEKNVTVTIMPRGVARFVLGGDGLPRGTYRITPGNNSSKFDAIVIRRAEQPALSYAARSAEGSCPSGAQYVSTKDGIQPILTLSNRSETSKQYSVQAVDENGQTITVKDRNVSALSTTSIPLTDLFGFERVGSLRVRCLGEAEPSGHLIYELIHYGFKNDEPTPHWAYAAQPAQANVKATLVFSLSAESASKPADEVAFTNISGNPTNAQVVLLNKKGEQAASIANDVPGHGTVTEDLRPKVGAGFTGVGRVEPGKDGNGVTVEAFSTTRAADGSVLLRRSIPLFALGGGKNGDLLDDLSTIDPGRTSATVATGSVSVERIGTSNSTRANLNASVTSAGYKTVNPAVWSYLNPSIIYAHFTNLSGYNERVGGCDYPIGGTPCEVPTYPSIPTCSSGDCSSAVTTKIGMMSRVVIRYTPTSQALVGTAELQRFNSPSGTYSNLDASATAASKTSATIATWTNQSEGLHAFHVTDLPGYTEYAGFCSYPIGGTRCVPDASSYAGASCSNGTCSRSGQISSGKVLLAIFQYIKPNDASCVSLNVPTLVRPGEKFTATARMLNTGTAKWTSDTTPHRLGSVGDATTWGLTRVVLPFDTARDSFADFQISATAPMAPGTYAFNWKMVEDGVEWFGAPCQQQITVTPFDYSITSNGDKRGDIATYPNTKKTTTLDLWLAKAPSLPVTLSIDNNLPAGMTANLSTTTCSPNCSPVLTVTTSSATPPGIYLLTVRGAPFNKTLTLNIVVAQTPVSTDRFIPNDRVTAAWYQQIPIRRTPGDSGVLIKNESNTAMMTGVVDSSRYLVEGKNWWRVKFDAGTVGWVPGEALASQREIDSSIALRKSASSLPSYKGEMDIVSGISVTDGVLALRCAAGLTPCDPNQPMIDSRDLDLMRKIADVDCSGTPTVSDAVNILRRAAGQSVSFCDFDDFNYWFAAANGFANGNELRIVAGAERPTVAFVEVHTTATRSGTLYYGLTSTTPGITVTISSVGCDLSQSYGCPAIGVSAKAGVGMTPGRYPFVVKGSLLNQEFRGVLVVTASPPRVDMDFNGDRFSDPVTFDRGHWSGIPDNGDVIFGEKYDIPVPADYDGDKKTDIAVWRQQDASAGNQGKFWVWGQSGAALGTVNDVPIPADYDGDGKADFAVWRPSNKTAYIKYANNLATTVEVPWSTPADGDIPYVGNFIGVQKKADLAFWRRGQWYVKELNTGAESSTAAGHPYDVPVPGDFNGDEITDIAIAKAWDTNTNKPLEKYQWVLPGRDPIEFGYVGGDIPAPLDYNGDGKLDPAVWGIIRTDVIHGQNDQTVYYVGWKIFLDTNNIVTKEETTPLFLTSNLTPRLPLSVAYRFLNRGAAGKVGWSCGRSTVPYERFNIYDICFPNEEPPPPPASGTDNGPGSHPSIPGGNTSRQGTPGFIGIGSPYQPPRIRVKLWALPDATRNLKWRVGVWDADTDALISRTESAVGQTEIVPKRADGSNFGPGRYNLSFTYETPDGWKYLDSTPTGSVISDYCINCFDHPIKRFDPWADTIDDIQVDTFVDVSIIAIPEGGSFSYESENFNIDDITRNQLELVEQHNMFASSGSEPQERIRTSNIATLPTSSNAPSILWKWPTCTIPALSITPSLYQPSALNMNMDFRSEIRAAHTQWSGTGSRAQIQPLRELAEDFPPLKNYGFNTIHLVPNSLLWFDSSNQLVSFQTMNATGTTRFLALVGPISGSGNPNDSYGQRGILAADILLSDILLSTKYAKNEQERRNMIYNVFLHEMGHYLGVGHGSDRNIVMTAVGLDFLKVENSTARLPLTSQDVQPFIDGFKNCLF